MINYAFTLYNAILEFYATERQFSYETKLSDIFLDELDEYPWFNILIRLELTYGIDIPDSVAKEKHLTITEFGEKLSKLSIIPQTIYPEYYEIKKQILENIITYCRIENAIEEGTQEDLDKINEELNFIEDRLEEISGFQLN